MSTLLGLVVLVKKSKLPCSNQIPLPILSNHVTLFDHLVVCLTKACVTPHSHVFHWYSSFVPLNNLSIAELIGSRIQKDDEPVHLFPEQTPSDQPDRLLTFDETMLEVLDKIQPVCLKVIRPFPIKLVNYPIRCYIELLWQFFTPFTIYLVEYSEPMGRKPKESVKEFTERIRRQIADALGASLSDITAQELIGDITHDKSMCTSFHSTVSIISSTTSASPRSSISLIRSASTSSVQESGFLRNRKNNYEITETEDTEDTDQLSATVFDHLIPVVQDVLHHVPVHQIRNALCRADGDVDNAIDSLLTQPEDVNPEVLTSSAAADSDLVPVSRLNTASEVFHSSSIARESCLQDRRRMLLMHGRKQFAMQSSTS